MYQVAKIKELERGVVISIVLTKTETLKDAKKRIINDIFHDDVDEMTYEEVCRDVTFENELGYEETLLNLPWDRFCEVFNKANEYNNRRPRYSIQKIEDKIDYSFDEDDKKVFEELQQAAIQEEQEWEQYLIEEKERKYEQLKKELGK